jgi:hypothetical protein
VRNKIDEHIYVWCQVSCKSCFQLTDVISAHEKQAPCSLVESTVATRKEKRFDSTSLNVVNTLGVARSI